MRLYALNRQRGGAKPRIKPQIPATGNHGIPIRDEIELEAVLS